MRVEYIKQKTAKDFIRAHHRHHSVPSTGAIFTLGLFTDDGVLHGVAMCGRPIARAYDSRLEQGHKVLEITRLCTDGIANGCSMLYARCVEVAKALGGFESVITYTQVDEPGSSLAGTAHFTCEGICGAPDWGGNRKRGENGVRKLRWRYSLTAEEKTCKDPVLSASRRQKSTLTWLNIVRHKLDSDVDDIFFAGNTGHDSLVSLFPWSSQGQEGIINERLCSAELPLIEFSVTIDDIMEYVPSASGIEFSLSEEDMEANYNSCMGLCDRLMRDITDYLIRVDLILGTDYRARLSQTA